MSGPVLPRSLVRRWSRVRSAGGNGGDSIARLQEDALDFYQGKVLRIDLSAGTSAVEPLNMEWAERYIGGKGLLLRYMWEEIPPGLDPWSAGQPRLPRDRPVRRHQRQHVVASRRGLQEPGDRRPQRQLRGRLVRARDEVRRLRHDHHHRARSPEPDGGHHQGRRGRVPAGAAQVLGHEDVRDRAGHARRLRRERQGRSPSARPASRRSPGPASPPTSTTRPDVAVTAPSWATRTSRPSPSAAPAR